jgi:hypothetical protein
LSVASGVSSGGGGRIPRKKQKVLRRKVKSMLYKFPMPSEHSGVKLYALPKQQLGIEVARPQNATMAYDHELAAGRIVTIGRPDIDEIIADAVRQVDAMPKAGKPPIRSNDMASNDDNDAALGKILDFLENIVSPDDLEIVQALFCGASDVDEAREQQAVTRRDDDRRTGRQAADAARRRGMSESTEASYLRMFPNSGRLA